MIVALARMAAAEAEAEAEADSDSKSAVPWYLWEGLTDPSAWSSQPSHPSTRVPLSWKIVNASIASTYWTTSSREDKERSRISCKLCMAPYV